jgi:hypothetical protein
MRPVILILKQKYLLNCILYTQEVVLGRRVMLGFKKERIHIFPPIIGNID